MTIIQEEKWPADDKVEEAIAGKMKLGDLGGLVTVMNFSANETSKDSKAVGNRMGEMFGTDERIRWISVTDLTGIPMLMHSMAAGIVKKVATKARENFLNLAKEKGLKVPDDLVYARPFLIDYNGKLSKKLCQGYPRKNVQIVLLDANGVIRGRFEGPNCVDAAAAKLRELLG